MEEHSINQRLPVVLLQGFLAPKQSCLPIKWFLDKHGFQAFLLDLPLLNLTDIATIARRISAGVDEVLEEAGTDRCDMVGVSLGGIAGLYYLKKMAGNDKTRSFVAFGTPFRGTWKGLLAAPLIGAFSKSLWQLLPSNPLLAELIKAPCEGTRVYSVFAANDPIATPTRSKIPWAENHMVKSLPFPISHQGMLVSRHALAAVAAILESQE